MKNIFSFLPVITLVFSTAALSQAVNLDPAFGTGGMVIETAPEDAGYANRVLIQPDGKILIAGINSFSPMFFCIVRYNADGTRDLSFGTDGLVKTDVGEPANDGISDMVLQPDGKIVAMGSVFIGGNYQTVVARYNTDGSLDSGFDSDGITYVDLGSGSDPAEAIGLQPDGKIVFAQGYYTVFSIVRLNQDGTIDLSFDTDGVLQTSFGGFGDSPFDLAMQADGKMVVVGNSYDVILEELLIGVARYNTDGTLDNTFSGDGQLMTQVGTGSVQINKLVIRPGGEIAVGGSVETINNLDGLVYQFLSDGTTDLSFGAAGKTIFNYEDYTTQSMALQDDGKLVLATLMGSLDDDFVVVRLNEDGALDNTFSDDGYVVVNLDDNVGSAASDVAIQSDGKIVATGGAEGSLMTIRLTEESLAGIENQTETDRLEVFPNPTATGDFRLLLPVALANATVVITDVNGKIILHEDGVNGNPLFFSISDQEAGIYFVEISSQTEVYRTKISKN